MISNSEVGAGAVVIAPLVHRLVCMNGMVVNDSKFRRNHVGPQAATDEAVYQMLTDEALEADDKAILLKVSGCREGLSGSGPVLADCCEDEGSR